MAVAARQTQMFRGDNGVNVGRVVDTVVDERTGIAAQREQSSQLYLTSMAT